MASFLCLAACRRQASPEEIRLLILPLENQTSSTDLDWQVPASAAVLDYDLAGLPRFAARAGDSLRAAPALRANRVLQGYFTQNQNRISLHATLQNPLGPKTLRTIDREGPSSQGLLPLLDSLAKDLNPSARPFSSHDPAAFRSFGDALASSDPGARARLLQTATIQDPKFTAAAIALAGTLLAQSKPEEAATAASEAARSATHPADRAQLEYLAATASGNLAGRDRALSRLVELQPQNADDLRLLADVKTAERKFPEAIRACESAARLLPDDPGLPNQLGYLYAFTHDLERARRSLKRYQELASPTDANPRDSLGEVSFYLGDFPAAERYFLDAHRLQPRATLELLKAAQARLLTGDLAGANQLFAQYHPREIEIAQWEFITGRRRQAMARAGRLQSDSDPDASALAFAHLSIWNLQTGNRAQAARLAAAAQARAASPALKNAAVLCRFLAAGPALTAPVPLIQGLSLVLARQSAAAIPILENVYHASAPGNDGDVRVILAWAYNDAGTPAKAAPLTGLYPFPFSTNGPIFSGLLFPRFLQLRAAALTAEHRDAQARPMQKLFEQFAGDLPDRFSKP